MRKIFLYLMLATTLWSPAMAQDLHADGGNAQAEKALPPLTPESLQQAIECRGSGEAMLSYAGKLFSDKPPSWLKQVHGDHSGLIGLWSYRLDRPITVFGQKADTISFLNDWIVVELPRAQALAIVQQQKMQRAPIHATEQYFRFVDAENGPMYGAFAPGDDALDIVFGAAPKPDSENKTLFVGCNYAAVSEEDFLAAARQADAAIVKSGRETLHMLDKKH